ncbi:MAG: glycosyltransferase family 4 protein [Saprospirales bacterium]|nr:glycosyltransferase family 4 protein [Saprospirales bacterium]
MNPVKVCHLTSVHYWSDTRILHRECASLARKGMEVHLVVANQEVEAFPGVTIHSVQAPARNRLQRMQAVTGAIFRKALEIDADLYHFHDPELMPVGRRLQRKGKKVIFDVHEHVPNQIRTKQYLPAFIRPLIAGMYDQYEKYMAGKMDGIVTAVDTVRDRLLPYNPLTIDINNYPEPDMLYVEEDWSKKKRDVCYVGLLNEIRGIGELLAALEEPGDWRLTLVGYFETPELEARMKTRPGWDRVDFVGRQSRKEVARFLAESKIGIVTFLPAPNHNKNQPNKLFEYMAAGIPVVCSHFTRWKKIVEDAGCGKCVDPANPKEIAHAIAELLAHPEEAQATGMRGRKAMESTYNWQTEEEKLWAFYQKVLLT